MEKETSFEDRGAKFLKFVQQKKKRKRSEQREVRQVLFEKRKIRRDAFDRTTNRKNAKIERSTRYHTERRRTKTRRTQTELGLLGSNRSGSFVSLVAKQKKCTEALRLNGRHSLKGVEKSSRRAMRCTNTHTLEYRTPRCGADTHTHTQNEKGRDFSAAQALCLYTQRAQTEKVLRCSACCTGWRREKPHRQ